jgi:hypothetical protein
MRNLMRHIYKLAVIILKNYMNKRYQVFVSSTFADLQEERSKVIQTIMELDCIPAGMDIFPAIDEEQFEFIKKVIDDCDYYILIVGGRYGSLSEDGVSYTEKEYNYALEKDIKVIALIHADPDSIPLGKSEKDDKLRQKLEDFKQRVTTGRLVKFWNNAEELAGLVALSLSKTIKTYPAIGWVRGNTTSNIEALEELNQQRKLNDELKNELDKLKKNLDTKPVFDDLADLSQEIIVKGKNSGKYSNSWEINISWKNLFYIISPYLLENPVDSIVKEKLTRELFNKTGNSNSGYSPSINSEIYETIKIQFKLLKLIDISYSKSTNGNMGLFWKLTKAGENLMYDLRGVRNENKL